MIELAPILNPLIHRELASIGAIDTAMATDSHPDYVIVFEAAKSGKQANIEQMNAMIRASGEKPAESARFLELLLRAQTSLMEKIGTTPTMRAMRIVERELITEYAEAVDRVDGIVKRGLQKCWHRAIKHYIVLTAHIAKRGHFEVEETLALPLPITQYFAANEARACMRCLFDRPGQNGPLMRSDPHPYTYICAACHDEVLADFPPDLLEKAPRWTEHDRNSRVIEKALGRPSKLKAEELVLAKMSGIAADMPPAPVPYKSAHASVFDTALPSPVPSQMNVTNTATTLDERLYTELLFDFESVRDNW